MCDFVESKQSFGSSALKIGKNHFGLKGGNFLDYDEIDSTDGEDVDGLGDRLEGGDLVEGGPGPTLDRTTSRRDHHLTPMAIVAQATTVNVASPTSAQPLSRTAPLRILTKLDTLMTTINKNARHSKPVER